MEQAPPSSAATAKRVLVLQYSQTGQLDAVVAQILAPLREAGVALHVEALRPEPAFPFPWSFFRFLDAFPESAHMLPPALAPLGLHGDEDFDLVILPYQVWFLAPSQPVVAFLKHPVAARLLRGKPVVTVIACRNMWLMAQQKMRGLLDALGARLLDNVVFTDPAPALATFITTPRWLLTGRRDAFLGLPPAGVNEQQTRAARRFGLALRDALVADAERGRAPLLAGLQAATVDPRLWFSERVGTRSFFLWGHLLRLAGGPGAPMRKPLLLVYVSFLVCAILTLVPLSLLLQALLRPLLRGRLARLKTEHEHPSGCGRERMQHYDF